MTFSMKTPKKKLSEARCHSAYEYDAKERKSATGDRLLLSIHDKESSLLHPEFDSKTSRRRLASPGLNPSIFKLQSSPESVFNDRSLSDVDLGTALIQVEKECASCGTFKTPLWRDAKDGTHLCNACGIRYKKYGIRCVRCWYIPKNKEEKLCPAVLAAVAKETHKQ
ncbi:GATA-type zinc finger protein 1 [Desmophyllum pertusum]|uniref:GATA-type zinc finger protein 1 n=1 Tax=Desmophyllum pertusum TaxID=174260 RepID=A0A9X0CIL9_9CNID|nr:GATA-type zinc finger protein 1 [Desmophyllum pertusum]